MATITGIYQSVYSNGSMGEPEYHTIEAEIDTRVVFVDNSYLSYCYINSPDGSDVYPASNQYDPQPQWEGRIVKIDSLQEAYNPWNPARITMPIAVICDNGEILYCNPLNIKVIESNN